MFIMSTFSLEPTLSNGLLLIWRAIILCDLQAIFSLFIGEGETAVGVLCYFCYIKQDMKIVINLLDYNNSSYM